MYRGQKVDGTVHVATSDDGVHFRIDPEPLPLAVENPVLGAIRAQGIDFRITKIEDTYYVVHPTGGGWGTAALLSRTRDFKTFETLDVVALPDNRVPCLFPEKINGLYARLDRPYRVAPNDFHEAGNIWISYSPDLVFWGRHRPLLKTGYSYWAGTKIGPTPPIKTDAGWLVILHGVSRSCTGHRYCIGAMLLDLENPERILGKTHSAILAPAEPYEFNGVVPNVVFPCGAIADLAEDRIRVYYGCADSYVGLASGSLSELIAACREGR
jgi:beta-1,4-mannooligosaccharide/beta-1,4-mannosyl-N-acetylglucosamine phosphorylase